MAQTSRITNTGTYFVSGSFDEFTGAPVVDANLMVWLDTGQTASYSGTGNTWTNLANVSANTTLVNSPTFDTQGWLAFNGTNQTASTGLPGATTFTTDSDFTISCWARLSAYKPAATSIGTLVGALAYQGYGLYWSGSPTSYTFGSYMRYSSVTSSVTSAAVSPGTWYLVTQVYSRTGNFHRLYLNGVLSGSTTTISGTFNTNLNNVFISIAGGTAGVSDGTPGGGTSGTPFLGDISQVLIYNRILSAVEITQNYNAGCQRYGLSPITSTQMPVVKRETSSGTILINSGEFDEVTYSSTSPVFKNLLTYSEDFSSWGNSLNTITTNTTTAPDGTQTADRIQVDASGYTATLNIPTVNGITYVLSFYVKSVSGTSGTWPVNYYNGAHNRSTVPITGNWERQYFTFTGTGSQINVYIADNRSALATITDGYVWGAQLETGSIPTIYQGVTAANTLVTPNFVKKETNTGSIFVTGLFDEYSPAFPDGLSAATASTSAYAIKQAYPASTDGLYWIRNDNINGGSPVQVYCDMTTLGGGWTLIMQNNNNDWTFSNALLRNQTSAPSSLVASGTTTMNAANNYSIIGWADYIKKSASGFDYMLDAWYRGRNGGAWTANQAYSFTGQVDNTAYNASPSTYFGTDEIAGSNGFRQDITAISLFNTGASGSGTWTYNNAGLEKRMPWYANNAASPGNPFVGNAIFTTTNDDGGSWWGTLMTNNTGWTPAPWQADTGLGNPYVIWYWVR